MGSRHRDERDEARSLNRGRHVGDRVRQRGRDRPRLAPADVELLRVAAAREGCLRGARAVLREPDARFRVHRLRVARRDPARGATAPPADHTEGRVALIAARPPVDPHGGPWRIRHTPLDVWGLSQLDAGAALHASDVGGRTFVTMPNDPTPSAYTMLLQPTEPPGRLDGALELAFAVAVSPPRFPFPKGVAVEGKGELPELVTRWGADEHLVG